MPYTSVQQARFFHSPTGMKKIGAKKVKEFDAATPKGSLAGTRGSKQKTHKKLVPVSSLLHAKR